MSERPDEYWWVEWAEGMFEPARIEYPDGRPPQISEIGSDYAMDLAERGVRLVAPVVPLSIASDVAAVTAEQHRDLGVALAEAMMAMFRASFHGGTPLIALRGSHLISPDVQADVERWYATWDARHRDGIRAMHRAMDLLREAKDEAAA
ncbi:MULTISPECIES: hypothetical protein [unclassified Methylobacterium]|uniref:hypothetical protein n=1 Tax=unclassified Methylobacterium TaxID=2615210 RepID=UPI0005BC7419|nr:MULTISPECIES: hypothetical protein [unclassified Methylobacterium]SFU50241.1 hypothetical protein SAMN02799643_00944 [Methylobacterium sp. UNCCL125]